MSKKVKFFNVICLIWIVLSSIYFYYSNFQLNKKLESQESYYQECIQNFQKCKEDNKSDQDEKKKSRDDIKVEREVLPETVVMNIETYAQQYPASCEIASAHIAMKYFGVEKSEDEILEIVQIDPTELEQMEDGRWHWGNPQKKYVGSLYLPGGVYNEPVYRALSEFGFSQSISKTGWQIAELYSYIRQGYPAIVWVSSDFKTQPLTKTYADDGTENVWMPHQHALILKGVDSEKTYIMDVWKGTHYTVTHEQFKTGFANLDNMAIVVIQDE
ncbi:hypothetical protein GF362_05930 [Candidatus Dojkabacteria bacterium]|nr:hypothetical protein [Candidatus Dojkabacteria bacterium]